jgi:membrane protease YdiL (CAAX protease family)
VILFGVVIPVLAVRNRRQLSGGARPLPPRMTHFRSTAVMSVVLASFSLAVARVEHIDRVLFRGPDHLLAALTAGVAMYATAVVFMRPRWRRAVARRTRVVYLFMPETAAERTWWIVVSVLAGIGEEITWRGVQTALLVALSGSYWTAALVSAISFALAHFLQGWKTSVLIVIFALGFQGLAWLAGSLYVAMLVHVAYDITAGLSYGQFARELGYRVEENPTGSIAPPSA